MLDTRMRRRSFLKALGFTGVGLVVDGPKFLAGALPNPVGDAEFDRKYKVEWYEDWSDYGSRYGLAMKIDYHGTQFRNGYAFYNYHLACTARDEAQVRYEFNMRKAEAEACLRAWAREMVAKADAGLLRTGIDTI